MHVYLTFAFRTFGRCFYPKRLTKSTLVKGDSNISLWYIKIRFQAFIVARLILFLQTLNVKEFTLYFNEHLNTLLLRRLQWHCLVPLLTRWAATWRPPCSLSGWCAARATSAPCSACRGSWCPVSTAAGSLTSITTTGWPISRRRSACPSVRVSAMRGIISPRWLELSLVGDSSLAPKPNSLPRGLCFVSAPIGGDAFCALVFWA